MKDEIADVVIKEFIGLKSKMYPFLMIVVSIKSKGCELKCCCNDKS